MRFRSCCHVRHRKQSQMECQNDAPVHATAKAIAKGAAMAGTETVNPRLPFAHTYVLRNLRKQPDR